jgi:hypothetical protein
MTKPPVFEQLSERQLVRKVTSPEVDGRGGEKKKKVRPPSEKSTPLAFRFPSV